MRQRWFSRRAILIHLGALLFVPLCLLAWWWQVTRAIGGNDLSYVYAVEWPVLAIIGVYVWWALIHTDFEKVGARAQAKQLAEQAVQADRAEQAEGDGASVAFVPAPEEGPRRRELEDEELAAYNDRLEELARQGPKTWRRSSA